MGGGTNVSYSYYAFDVAFFLDWFTYLFYFLAVKNTPAIGDDSRWHSQLASSSLADELKASQKRVRELEQELARRDAQDAARNPNSVMLHPSVPVAQGRQAQSAAVQPWPHVYAANASPFDDQPL